MLQPDQWKQLQGMEKHMEREITKMIRVYGIVQGVGFRPTVSRHAMARGIRGSVSNKGPYVEIFAQGKQQDVDAFIADIGNKPPKRAAILKLLEEPVEEPEKFTQFDIIESEKTKGEIFVSPDIAICDECKAEMFDPENRRYLHPFINCTCCGPRLTILDSLPYDRERTSMKEFPMCPSCADEYHNPDTRRYDAQPVCCNDCGPEVYLAGRKERGREAITYTRKIIASGGIVAIKGIGGFHLCCDATSEEAVQRLRQRKRRPVKPFAVMRRHILPNVMHIVLIVTVLDFSGIVLYEAVLSYVGVGVDPTMHSFGTMINSARSELSRSPMIWWNLLASFLFLVTLVLSANIFASAVRDAFDPRAAGRGRA